MFVVVLVVAHLSQTWFQVLLRLIPCIAVVPKSVSAFQSGN